MNRLSCLAAHISAAHARSVQEACACSAINPMQVAAVQGPQEHHGPLKGIRVLDMSAVISGPWSTSIMADQGADVIKIESPAGPDMTRALGPSPTPGLGAMYVTANRGKRSITLDVQKPEGVAVLKRLVTKCDVVVQNYRPGVAKRLGVDYATLSAVNPELVHLSISGFGPSGPYVEAKVYDQIVQAISGVPSIMSDGGEPVMFHNLLIDKVTALNAAQSITAALLARAQGKGGQHVELNMLDSAMHFLYPDTYWNKVWRDVKPMPMEWRQIAKNTEYHAADGKLAISATDLKQLHGLLEVAGLTELRSDSVGKMRAEAIKPVRDRLRTMSKQDIFEKCLRHGVPCGVFQTLDEALSDPQIRHNGTVQEHVHPDGGHYYSPRPPAQFGKTPSDVQGPAPKMGIDTANVLQQFGFTAEEVATLKAKHVV